MVLIGEGIRGGLMHPFDLRGEHRTRVDPEPGKRVFAHLMMIAGLASLFIGGGMGGGRDRGETALNR